MCQPSTTNPSKDSSNEETYGDLRWKLTEEEKEAVRQLKEAADNEGIYYQNLFELAKYALVVRSLEKDDEKRLEVALRRLRNRHEWMNHHDLWSVDKVAAHAEIGDRACPAHFVQRFERDIAHDRTVVALHMAHSPLHYIEKSPEHYSKYLAAAMYRMDLGAVDMEEARRGMVLAAISEGQLTFGRGWKYMKFMKKISGDMKDMHPHMVKAVHAEFPSLVAHMLPAVKRVLPQKVADRLHVYSSIKDMSKNLERFNEETSSDDDDEEIDDMTAEEWARRREEKYQETVTKLSLD